MYILHSPDWHYRSTMPTFLFLYGVFFAVVHSFVHLGIGFKVHYGILCFLCIPRMYKYYIYTKDASAKRLAKLYVATLFLGSLCWLCDHLFCKEISSWLINPQGHAMWHVFMGFNSYFANTFLMFCRAHQREWSPKIAYLMGVLPYVKVDKPKAQWKKHISDVSIGYLETFWQMTDLTSYHFCSLFRDGFNSMAYQSGYAIEISVVIKVEHVPYL